MRDVTATSGVDIFVNCPVLGCVAKASLLTVHETQLVRLELHDALLDPRVVTIAFHTAT